LVAVTVEARQSVNAFVTALMYLNFGAFIDITMQRLIGVVRTVRDFVTDKMIVDTLTVVASKLTSGARVVFFFTANFVRVIAAIILAICWF
jgi:predicted acylesterase/phospholipase RssA